ncbi:MAG: ATP-binding cassette domain-containing protein [Lachnospiraceae bacterium]|nr:ATP-binding cassette domain-containing protein [Lachnospiraceae bacterium]
MSLEVKNIVKKYGEKTVVDNISFEMKEPGVYALLGTNGAGKTTTIRIILGMLSHESGEVLWNGETLDAMKVNVGYLAEERGLYPKYTLMDQLLYFAKLKGVSKKEAEKRIKYLAERLKVEEYIYPENTSGKKGKKAKPKTADQLSKGNQQKIQMLAALISDPDIIVLDEPLSGLDPVNADLFKEIIKEEIEKNKYIIMSSHQMETIEAFCTDITILNRGKAVLQGNLNEIKKSYGRVNMIVKCDVDIDNYVNEFDFVNVDKNADEVCIRVKDENQAMDFLARLTQNKVPVVKFELREPSLHEIFVEKVGNDNEEE